MSEKSLDNVIRHLRIGMTYLDTSMEIADKVLADHLIATEIIGLKLQIKDYVEYLDRSYRASHFSEYSKRRRSK